MNKIKDFTDAERNKYGNLYFELTTKKDNLKEFLDEKQAVSRSFVRKMDAIQQYLDKLDEADRKASGSGFSELFKSDEKHKEDALRYKRSIQSDLDKLELCHKCACSSCVKECAFKTCSSCKSSYFVQECDKERYCVFKGLPDVELYSNDEERDVRFKVVGLLVDHYSNKKYIYLVERNNHDNQHILEHVHYVSGEVEYISLDEDILDKVYSTFEGLGCYE